MQDQSRYPGTRPFLEEERHLFFGRDRDKKKLGNLIVLEKLVVLFGKAGYGKSSLLNAGVIPYLRHIKHHLPIKIRLTPAEVKIKEPKAKPLEILIDQLNLQVEIINKDLEQKNREPCFLAAKMDIPKLLPEDLTAVLWYNIKIIQLTKEVNEATTLIFDQFEALFRYYDDAEADDFGRSMAALLHSNPPDEVLELISKNLNSFTDEELELLYEPLNLKLVFSVASDHLSLLNKLKQSLPDIFKYTYEIKALNKVQAQKVLEGPAQKEEKFASPKFTFTDEAIDKIFEYLIKVKNKEGIELENQDIETFQLQLIGQYAEEKIIAKKNRREFKSKIKGRFNKRKEGPENGKYELSLKDLGEPSNILKKFYKKVIFGLPPLKRNGAQKLVEKGLIIGGNRVPMSGSRIERDYNVAEETLGKLENKHLLRSEFKIKDGSGTKSYEISHYNLVKPIEESVRRRKIRRLWWLVLLLLAFIIGLISYIVFSDSDSGGSGEDREVSNGLIINAIGIATAWPPEGPAPHKVKFTFTKMDTLNEVKVVRYFWEFDDGTKSDYNVSELDHVYNSVRSYTARLHVICTDSLTHPIRTEEVEIIVKEPDSIIPPTPLKVGVRITADPPSGKVGDGVRFSATPIPDTLLIKSYLWEFMDGQTSAQATPAHTFNAKGNYIVRLKVLDNLDRIYRNSLAIQVDDESPPSNSLNQAPLARIWANPRPGNIGQAISFDGGTSSDDKAITKYLWEFDDGISSEKDSLTHAFATSGNYLVRLTVWDAEEEWNNDSINIKILDNRAPLPIARIKASETIGTAPFEVAFIGRNTNDNGFENTYLWNFNDGITSSLTNPKHVFAIPGTYDVQLTVTDIDNRLATANVAITVKPPIIHPSPQPIAKASASDYEGTLPLTVQFEGSNTAVNGSESTYKWDFRDGSPISTEQNPLHEFMTPGAYNVLLTVTDNEQVDTDELIINVKPSFPVAIASYDPTCSCSREFVYTDSKVDFIGSGSKSGVGIAKYSWNFGDGNTSTEADTDHTFVNTGTFMVELTITDSLKQTNTYSEEIKVVAPLNPKSEYEKWMTRLDSLKAAEEKKDTTDKAKAKRLRIKVDRDSNKGFKRDSVYLVAIHKSPDGPENYPRKQYDGLIILLDNNKVFKFRSPNVPYFPDSLKSASLLKPDRYSYKYPNTQRKLEKYMEGRFLEGQRFIDSVGRCSKIKKSIYKEFFDRINVDKEKKNEFYYIALNESDFDFDAEAIEEIDCTFELLKP